MLKTGVKRTLRNICVSMAGFGLALLVAAPPSQAADQKILSIATGGSGGTYFAIGGGMAALVSKYMPGYKLVVQSTAASIENIHLVANKKVDFAIVMPDSAYFATTGGREFSGKAKYDNLRAVTAGHASLLQAASLQSSKIKSFADLKGKKVALSAPGSPSKFLTMAALEAYDLKAGDYQDAYLTYAEMVEGLKDGNIDASAVFAGIPTSSMLDLATTTKINFLPVEESKFAFIKKNYPYYSKAVIPAKTYPGLDEPMTTLAAPSILITHSDVPDEVVYQLAKAILEHTEELAGIHAAGAEWNLKTATDGIAIPFHPGAKKYLKEKNKLD
ncbi:MAG: TAXI family TRAP transporter solute-binding subunit [Rhodospirillales bacterium]|nr:TAXI family TRAP transporter solute-binding subunit [Rhodospirillales bacterium]